MRSGAPRSRTSAILLATGWRRTSRLLGFGFGGGGSNECSCNTESESATGAAGSFLGPRQLRRTEEW